MMTLAQALKVKNRLQGRINRLRQWIIDENSILAENVRSGDIEEALDDLLCLEEKLLELKTAIAEANVPMIPTLQEMNLIRERLRFWGTVPTDTGLVPERRSLLSDSSPLEYEAYLTKADIEHRVRAGERLLASLQDKLDAFNARTEINVDVPEALVFPV